MPRPGPSRSGRMGGSLDCRGASSNSICATRSRSSGSASRSFGSVRPFLRRDDVVKVGDNDGHLVVDDERHRPNDNVAGEGRGVRLGRGCQRADRSRRHWFATWRSRVSRWRSRRVAEAVPLIPRLLSPCTRSRAFSSRRAAATFSRFSAVRLIKQSKSLVGL